MATRLFSLMSATLVLLTVTSCGPPTPPADSFSLVIGSRGTTSGHFDRPRGLVHSPALGAIFVVDWDGKIQHFTTNGQFRGSWMMPEVEIGKPEDLCLSKEGNILVADTHYSRVVEFTPSGDLVQTFGSYGREKGQFIYPVGICCDTNGNIYVSEYGESERIQVFSPKGEYLHSFGQYGDEPGSFMRPSGIDIGPDQLLYVADAVNHRVQVFTLDGTLVRVIGETPAKNGDTPVRFKYPYDLVIKKGKLYVLEYGANRISRLTLEGELLDTFGGAGSGEGQFNQPWRFAKADHSLYVSDTKNYRVVKIEY